MFLLVWSFFLLCPNSHENDFTTTKHFTLSSKRITQRKARQYTTSVLNSVCHSNCCSLSQSALPCGVVGGMPLLNTVPHDGSSPIKEVRGMPMQPTKLLDESSPSLTGAKVLKPMPSCSPPHGGVPVVNESGRGEGVASLTHEHGPCRVGGLQGQQLPALHDM